MYTCGVCKIQTCRTGEKNKMPKNCPCLNERIVKKSRAEYDKENNKWIAYNSALVEAEGYCQRTRIEEIMEFADKCNFKKIGIAHCLGFAKEADILTKILKANNFEIDTIACKCGSIPKHEIGIIKEQQIDPENNETMCNPIGQAMYLEDAQTDLNIIMGLCVGHDTLFIKYSKAPVTVFVVKDRVLGHNPLSAVYLYDSYYKEKLFKPYRKSGKL